MATLVRYNRIPAFFNSVYGRPVISRYTNTAQTVPAVNVKETETAFQLQLAAPGLRKEDLTVNVDNNKLTLAYKPQTQPDETAGTFTRLEFGVPAFERSFRLPKSVNVEQISAAYTNGILTVELPKVAVNDEKLVKEIAIA